MNTVAKVTIWGEMVGAVAWNDANGYTVFEFDSSFIKKGIDLSPIVMPVEEVSRGRKIFSYPALSKETFLGLPGFLADSLPDKYGNRLIETWLAQQGRDPASFNPVERLCYIGKRGMGALEYEPAYDDFDVSEKIEMNNLVKLAKQILKQKQQLKANISHKTDKGLLEVIRVGTSAGGARAKAIIAYNEKTGDVRSGQIDGLPDYEYWIIKFDGIVDKLLATPKGYGKIEYAYSLMAKACGINMSDCKLLKENKRAHFMTKRFDRAGNSKLHLLTLCGIAHFDYNDPAAYSYEQAFQIMRQLKLSYMDMEELFRRMIFNVVARNQDDHTKNISFLMNEKGNWSLSPAYDVTYSYDPKNKWLKAHQMSINGKRDDILRKDLLEFARNMNIKKAKETLDKTIEIVSHWNEYAAEADIEPEQMNAIGKVHLIKL